MRNPPYRRSITGTLGVNSATFRNVRVGCLGGVLLVVFTAGAMFGLVAMVWWMVEKLDGRPVTRHLFNFLTALSLVLCVAAVALSVRSYRSAGIWVWLNPAPGAVARVCRRCGYDLRASPERCPECGTQVFVDVTVDAATT